MKRKLRRLWREWGITLEEIKIILTGALLFASLYLTYLFMWLLQY